MFVAKFGKFSLFFTQHDTSHHYFFFFFQILFRENVFFFIIFVVLKLMPRIFNVDIIYKHCFYSFFEMKKDIFYNVFKI